VSLRRAALHAVLADHAARAGATVRTGRAVTGWTDRGAAVTVDGVDADLLVGADGLRSAVRRQLLGDGEPRYRGYTSVRGTGPRPPAHPHGFIAHGRGLILFTAPVDAEHVYWVASIAAPEGRWPAKDRATAHRDLLDALRGWHPDLVAPVAAADPGQLVLTDIHDRDPVPDWHRGRVVLLGDAAHPMSYTLGQGANQALEDAVTLAHHLAHGPGPDAALAAYAAARVPRTAEVVRTSRTMGAVGHARHPLTAWARDRVMGLVGRVGDQDRRNAGLFGWQPPASGDGAVRRG
jgi:2-polyprenyl-6-methoxyphenol hydroxylase-like FAD-dependent oxidoreductase